MRFSAEYVRDNLGKDLIVAEIGVWHGDNAEELLRDLPIKRLVLVDPYKEYKAEGVNPITQASLNEARDHAMRLVPPDGRVVWFLMTSVEAATQLREAQFDYVYIDANHNREFVRKDIEAWWPLVKKGGVMGGHDCDLEGVKKTIDSFFGTYKKDHSDWYVVK